MPNSQKFAFFYQPEQNEVWKIAMRHTVHTIKSRTAILRPITSYEEVLELWLGMSLNYYYLTSKDYLAIILDNPYGKIKEAALIWVQNYGTST